MQNCDFLYMKLDYKVPAFHVWNLIKVNLVPLPRKQTKNAQIFILKIKQERIQFIYIWNRIKRTLVSSLSWPMYLRIRATWSALLMMKTAKLFINKNRKHSNFRIKILKSINERKFRNITPNRQSRESCLSRHLKKRNKLGWHKTNTEGYLASSRVKFKKTASLTRLDEQKKVDCLLGHN